ncbi:MAG: RIP metalloprotease RseP [Bacteroidales bacterium]|nr:RIP metalloprotease RseP [Bacteroidales bacterium]
MNGLSMAAQMIVGLGFLVFIHEGGHFIAARCFGIRVTKFYLFFDSGFSLFKCKKINGKLRFKLFSKNLPDMEEVKDENGDSVLDEKGKKKYRLIDTSTLPDDDWRKYPENTEYGIGWLPFGGYCQISGMIDETQSIEHLASKPQPWEYRSKPAWQRLIVILAGVTVNLIAGIFLFAFILGHYEKEYMPNSAVTDGLYAFANGREIGFQTGDKILKVNGKDVVRYQDAVSARMYFGSIVTVERDGGTHNIVITDKAYSLFKKGGPFVQPFNYAFAVDSVLPGMAAEKAGLLKGDRILAINDSIDVPCWGAFHEHIRQFPDKTVSLTVLRDADTLQLSATPDSTGTVGLLATPPPYKTQSYTLGETMKYGWKDAMTMLYLNIKGLGKVFSGEDKARDSVAGPIGIAQIYGGVWDWGRFWYITGLLSLILAFMNVIPIPGLDGGHALFCLAELITGKKIPDRFLQYAQTIGMLLLLILMILIIGNDIFKLF